MESLQHYAEELVKEYKELLQLYTWNIKISMQTEPQYFKRHGRKFGCLTNGCAEISQVRKRARIFIKASLDHETMTSCIIHEMVHIPLNDMYVTGLTEMMNIEDKEKKDEYLENWERLLEVSVCRVTSAIDSLRARILPAKEVRRRQNGKLPLATP